MKTRIKIIDVDGIKTYIPQMRQWLFWSEWEATRNGAVQPSLFYIPLKPVSFSSMDDAQAFVTKELMKPHKKKIIIYQYSK